MNNPIHGHCHCKAIRFEITPPTQFCSHCHCESCRRIQGAAFVTWTSIEDHQLKLTQGKLSDLHRYESSPGIIWMRCSHCGSSLLQTTKYSPGRTYVNLAALSSPLDRQPEAHVSFEEKVPWLDVRDDLPQFKQKSSTLV